MPIQPCVLPISHHLFIKVTAFRNADGYEENWPAAEAQINRALSCKIYLKRAAAEVLYGLNVLIALVEITVSATFPLLLILPLCFAYVLKKVCKIEKLEDCVHDLMDDGMHYMLYAQQVCSATPIVSNLTELNIPTTPPVNKDLLEIARLNDETLKSNRATLQIQDEMFQKLTRHFQLQDAHFQALFRYFQVQDETLQEQNRIMQEQRDEFQFHTTIFQSRSGLYGLFQRRCADFQKGNGRMQKVSLLFRDLCSFREIVIRMLQRVTQRQFEVINNIQSLSRIQIQNQPEIQLNLDIAPAA